VVWVVGAPGAGWVGGSHQIQEVKFNIFSTTHYCVI